MIFNIAKGDVKADKSYTAKPGIQLAPGGEQVVYAVGPGLEDDGVIMLGNHVSTTATIKVGQLSAEVRRDQTWQFGFVQAGVQSQLKFGYAGARQNLGHISFDMTLDGSEEVFPDGPSANNPAVAARPWTRLPAQRYQFDAKAGLVTCSSLDGPGGKLPARLKNGETLVENHLWWIRDKRRYCCALVVEEKRENPAMRILAHSIWDISFFFELKWMKGKPLATSTISPTVKIGDFVSGAPTDAIFAKMIDPTFLGGSVYNDEISNRVKPAVRTAKNRFRADTDTNNAPSNFFI
jgi:hypothetical protein